MKTIGQEFMEKTQYKHLGPSDQEKELPQPPLELDYDKTKPVIDLPDPQKISIQNIGLQEAVQNRKSLRKYLENPLTLEELSYLLWMTQGVKTIVSRPATLRTVPSAGARHAFETYLLINKVEDIQPGLYRFIATEHKLVEVSLDAEMAVKVSEASLKQEFIQNSAITFIWVAVAYRMKWRYGERGYRYLHLDAGHVCQNLYLAAEAIDSGVCAIAAYDDDAMNQLLALDGEEQFVIYMATLGKRG